MFNRIALIAVLFAFVSVGLLASGCTVNIPQVRKTDLPTPKIYTQAEMYSVINSVRVLDIDEKITKTKRINKFTVASSIDTKQLKCLQENIYYESRNQSVLGQVMVAIVTLARTERKRYPDTICDVVFQRKQFSWANRGPRHPNLKNSIERSAWEWSGVIASVMIDSDAGKYFHNITHYHTKQVNPKWSKSEQLNEILRIGDHIFYSEQS